MRVDQVMTSPAVTIDADLPVAGVLRVFIDSNATFVPVVDRSGRPVGVVSASAFGTDPRRALDAVRGIAAAWGTRTVRLKARDLMAQPALTAEHDEEVHVVAHRMIEEGVRRMPVLADGRVVGVVSCSDLLHALFRTRSTLGWLAVGVGSGRA